ncbi:hypothetical protein [Micromonospora aurantiaca (nom. illeg.)]|uniref:hypothetical protein n=1 Tax=Micromonospora aurantiaca (nom. illeg.) TaxID=47850 RepID=UPI0033D62C42
MQPQSTRTREIKARYLTAGMAVVRDGFAEPLIALRVHRYDADTVLVGLDGIAGEMPYHVEEGVTVVDQPTSDPRVDLADVLRSLALDIIDYKLPLPRHYFVLRACLDSRADVQAWADFYGVPVAMGGTAGNIPCADQKIEFGDGQYFEIAVQGPAEATPEDPEKAALEARIAELEAQLAQGGGAR